VIFNVGKQHERWADWLIRHYIGGTAHTNTWASQRNAASQQLRGWLVWLGLGRRKRRRRR